MVECGTSYLKNARLWKCYGEYRAFGNRENRSQCISKAVKCLWPFDHFTFLGLI
jgi:hypothetical protein